jgi:hypothetical protein
MTVNFIYVLMVLIMEKKIILKLNQRGQFFSPDLALAFTLFLISLLFFIGASDNIISTINVTTTQRHYTNAINNAFDSLVFSNGEPNDWELKSLDDTNTFGLIKSYWILDNNKTNSFFAQMDANYSETTKKLGLSGYYVKVWLIDSNGTNIFASGTDSNKPKLRVVYERIISYNGNPVILRGVAGFE